MNMLLYGSTPFVLFFLLLTHLSMNWSIMTRSPGCISSRNEPQAVVTNTWEQFSSFNAQILAR